MGNTGSAGSTWIGVTYRSKCGRTLSSWNWQIPWIFVPSPALKATGTTHLADRSIHELSGGEKQRVLIARALAQEPRVVLLDEPTSFLDLRYKGEIFQLISSLSRDEGLAVVLVSHDIDLAAHFCHRLVMLKQGSVFEIGDPDHVITADNIEAVYECPVVVDKNPVTGRPRVNLA